MNIYKAEIKKFASMTGVMNITILAMNIKEAAHKAMQYRKKQGWNSVISVTFSDEVTVR